MRYFLLALLKKEKIYRLLFIISLIFATVALHKLILYHSPFSHSLFCIFIILSSFWFGLKGGLVSSVIASIFYAPRLLFINSLDTPEVLGQFAEILMFLVIGTITGILAERLESEKEQLRVQSERISQIQSQLRHAERLSILGEISASIAHEIRGPLANVKGAAEILMKEYPSGGDGREFLDILLKEVERLGRVTDAILKSAKSPVGDFKTCDINDLVNSSLYFTAPKAKRNDISVRFNRGNIPEILADADSLRQVFINIIENAIDAMEGGGSLNVNTSLNESGDGRKFIEITFSDTGKGIDNDKIKKIFQPFFTTKAHGTGLGLAISRRIVEKHGGMITVESEKEKGSIFRVIIPVDGNKTARRLDGRESAYH